MCLLDSSLYGNSHCSRIALSNRLCIRENGNVLKFEVKKIRSKVVFQCACLYILNRTTPHVLSFIYFRFVVEIRFSLRVNILLGGHAWRNPIFFLTILMSPKSEICCGINYMNSHHMSLLRRLSFWVFCLKFILTNVYIL
jgi:hypothetical protein